MKLIFLNIATLVALASLLGSAPALSAKHDRAELRSNTAYSEVLKIATEAPSEIVSYGESPEQFGELWLPKTTSENNDTLLILVHGGCWLAAFDIQHTHALSTALSRVGYAVWSLEYRRTGQIGGGWPGSLQDVLRGSVFGVSQIANMAKTKQTVILGHSAGGHLALLAASEPELKQHLTGAIGLAAITDPKLYAQGDNSCESVTNDFMGGTNSEQPAAYAKARVIATKLPANTYLLTGGKTQLLTVCRQKHC